MMHVKNVSYKVVAPSCLKINMLWQALSGGSLAEARAPKSRPYSRPSGSQVSRRIRLAIAVNKVASVFVVHTPRILVLPVVQSLLAGIWTLVWGISAAFLLSQAAGGGFERRETQILRGQENLLPY